MIATEGFTRRRERRPFNTHDDIVWDGRAAWIRMDKHTEITVSNWRWGLVIGIIAGAAIASFFWWINSL
jgi:hypothetical protein